MPSITGFSQSDWSTAASSKSTGVLSWNQGDLIVTVGGAGGDTADQDPSVPTATGLTFTTIDHWSGGTGSIPSSRSSQAVADSSGSSAITQTITATTKKHGIAAWVFSGGAAGDHREQHTSTQSVASTRVRDGSVYVWLVLDWNAGAVTTIIPTPTNQRTAEQDGTTYTVYVADLAGVNTNQSYGISGGGVGPFAILVMEIVDVSPITAVREFPPMTFGPF